MAAPVPDQKLAEIDLLTRVTVRRCCKCQAACLCPVRAPTFGTKGRGMGVGVAGGNVGLYYTPALHPHAYAPDPLSSMY